MKFDKWIADYRYNQSDVVIFAHVWHEEAIARQVVAIRAERDLVLGNA